MLRALLNKSWRQHPTNHPLRKLSKLDETDMRDCWRSKDELISDVLLWTPSHGCVKAGRPARTYIQQLCADTGCSPEDLWPWYDKRSSRRETLNSNLSNFALKGWSCITSYSCGGVGIYIYIYNEKLFEQLKNTKWARLPDDCLWVRFSQSSPYFWACVRQGKVKVTALVYKVRSKLAYNYQDKLINSRHLAVTRLTSGTPI